MKLECDKSMEFPLYLQDAKTGEVWEFRNPGELHALETIDDLSSDTFIGCDSERHELRIHCSGELVSIKRGRKQLEPTLYRKLVSASVH